MTDVALESSQLWADDPMLAIRLWKMGFRPMEPLLLRPGMSAMTAGLLFSIPIANLDLVPARVLRLPEARDDFGVVLVDTSHGTIECPETQEVWAR